MFTELMKYHICFPAAWVGQNNMAKNMGAFKQKQKNMTCWLMEQFYPGDSKWPFYPLLGGHLTLERDT